MISDINDKGKIYTNVINKQPIYAIVQTITHRIHGEVHVRPSERLKDELNRSETFIAITNATIYDLNGVEVYRSDFLTLNRDQIIWLIPATELKSEKSTGVSS